MKTRGSTDPKVGKKNDDPDKDSQGQDEDHVEEDLATVATLQEDQEEEVDDHQGKIGDAIRSEGVEQQHLTIHVGQGQINRIGQGTSCSRSNESDTPG